MTIREGADRLISETGLTELLQRYGDPYVTGSYYMDMMVWNDLDVYLRADESSFDIYGMIAAINAAMRPFRFDGIIQPEEKRLCYGFETRISGERWNVDIWIKDSESIHRSHDFCDSIVRRLENAPAKRQAVLDIKAGLIQMGLYGFDKDPRRHYHSHEIYSAVLEEDISSLAVFLERHPL